MIYREADCVHHKKVWVGFCLMLDSSAVLLCCLIHSNIYYVINPLLQPTIHFLCLSSQHSTVVSVVRSRVQESWDIDVIYFLAIRKALS